MIILTILVRLSTHRTGLTTIVKELVTALTTNYQELLPICDPMLINDLLTTDTMIYWVRRQLVGKPCFPIPILTAIGCAATPSPLLDVLLGQPILCQAINKALLQFHDSLY
jgi:hypothetical protein